MPQEQAEEEIYRHTQPGKLTIFLLGTLIWVLVVLVLAVGSEPVLWLLLVIFSQLLLLFHSLTVRVTSQRVQWWFGLGLIRKSVPIHQIGEVKPVTNPWYYGWGIRLTPRGWLFNVSGREAVEIKLPDRCYRIGTDEPDRLVAAIQKAQGRR